MTERPQPPAQAANPVLVEITRGDVVESAHRGAAVVVAADGGIVAAWGDIEHRVYPRSAVKPIQALPLIETGAARHFALSPAEIALACASHGGEAAHVTAVQEMMGRAGLGESDLECGAHAPTDEPSAQDLVRRGGRPSPYHNNCSGKHAGFLLTARHMGEATAGYIRREHPVQQRVISAMGEMTGTAMGTCSCGIDGCGIPAFALPLSAIALGMARLADPSRLGAARAAAAETVLNAMRAEPYMVAGEGRPTTTIMRAVPGVVVKSGAEGVFIAAVPAKGWGIAVKIDDGTRRAADIAIAALLRGLKLAEGDALAALAMPPVLNAAGRNVGVMRASPDWVF